jgi:hypothetical protein
MRYTTTAKYYNSAGVILSELTDEFETRPNEPRFSRARGCGKEYSGNWTPGAYRVEIDIDYRHVRAAEFVIFDDVAERLAELRRPLFGNLAAKTPWELPTPSLGLPEIVWKERWRKK